MAPARRYAPFVAVILAQLVLVAVAPSKGRVEQAPSYAATGSTEQPGTASGGPPSSLPRSDGGGAPAAGGASGGPGAEVTTPVTGGTTGSAAGGGSATGGAKPEFRCTGKRQFYDWPQAPPCVAHTGNPGATSLGVSGKTIQLVYFREKDNPVVKGVLQSIGLYSNPSDQRAFVAAMEDFINKKYELYDRKVKIAFWQSPCESAPPDDSCMRNDAKALVSKLKPFAVLYDNNTNAPSFFDQLSKLKVVNFGGWHFMDSFSTSHRPYHYDNLMGGDFQAQLTGEYFCKRLAGKKARWAGSADLRAKERHVAVFYPQTAVNTEPAKRLQSIIRGCGTTVEDIPYSPDTATASSQATSQVARAKASGTTTVMYFSDPIAPLFGTKAMTSQGWFPEHVLVGSGLIDYDVLGRLYDPQQWRHAFGPSDTVVYRPLGQQEASVTWRAAGRQGNAYSSAELQWGYWAAISCGIQMAGPQLTPFTFEAALIGGRCNASPWAVTRNPYVTYSAFGKGDYTNSSDAKEVWWDANARSPIDGKEGAYQPLNGGRRYRIGEWPTGDPALPAGF